VVSAQTNLELVLQPSHHYFRSFLLILQGMEVYGRTNRKQDCRSKSQSES